MHLSKTSGRWVHTVRLPLFWGSKVKWKLTTNPSESAIDLSFMYVESGGRLGALQPWGWSDIAKHIKNTTRTKRQLSLKCHHHLIGIIRSDPLRAIPKLSGTIVELLSQSPASIHELWLNELAAHIDEPSYEVLYEAVMGGLFANPALREHGILSFVAEVPCANMNQTLRTVEMLLKLAQERLLSPSRTDALLSAFWLVHPKTPFEHLVSYLPQVSRFNNRNDYIEQVRSKWVELLPFMESTEGK